MENKKCNKKVKLKICLSVKETSFCLTLEKQHVSHNSLFCLLTVTWIALVSDNYPILFPASVTTTQEPHAVTYS